MESGADLQTHIAAPRAVAVLPVCHENGFRMGAECAYFLRWEGTQNVQRKYADG